MFLTHESSRNVFSEAARMGTIKTMAQTMMLGKTTTQTKTMMAVGSGGWVRGLGGAGKVFGLAAGLGGEWGEWRGLGGGMEDDMVNDMMMNDASWEDEEEEAMDADNGDAPANDESEEEEEEEEETVYTLADVAAHKSKESGIWVTYEDGVYDITEFVAAHPGGDVILQAAGGAVDPFWAIYEQHKTEFVAGVLESLKIGVLSPEEAEKARSLRADKGEKQASGGGDPYGNEPVGERSSDLIVLKEKPFNAESPLGLGGHMAFLTPTDLWYCRSHHPIPDLHPSEYKLQVILPGALIGAEGEEVVKEFSLEEVQDLVGKTKTVVTVACAGNRRAGLGEGTQGLPWGIGAISTGEFEGTLVSAVLAAAGLDLSVEEAESGGLHLQVTGYDVPYDASVPLHKVLMPRSDVMLAYNMNGAPMNREHGAPIRFVIPGVAGARQVKWVTQIRVAEEPAYSSWQRGVAYRGYGPLVSSFDGLDVDSALEVYELPVTSAITVVDPPPAPGAHLDLQGFAYSGGGRAIVRVEVSADGGKTWALASLGQGSEQPPDKAWAWTLWSAQVDVPEQGGELICRAVDASYNSQPESIDPVYNLRGILNNSWHRIPIPATL